MAGELSFARQMVIDEMKNRVEVAYDRTVRRNVALWLEQAQSYIGATPELGEAEAILFSTQTAHTTPPSLKLPDRFDAETLLIRDRQQRLRDLIQKF